ncbi:MAG: DUF1295 domain-containing protein [Hyphomicrobiaceae bacterium]|nr:DUF1295 domain-containing protein [Hyphomicrobiaceae bacterium]
MDLYGQKSASIPQKLTVTGLELIILFVSAWVMFWGGERLFAPLFGGTLPDGIPARRYVIIVFSLIILGRMAFTMFYLMKRSLKWDEAFTVPFAFALYYLGFAILVLPSDAPLGLWDYLGMVLFALGCILNTGGELQRDRFKKDPANRGKLFTGGFFALSMHINFFGDVLWIVGYAIIAQSLWGWAIPVFIFCFFAFYNVPMLDRHLAEHYGEQFAAYAAKTRKLVPFVW